MEKAHIGIIGGSGLYQMEGLRDVREVSIDTPFGKPSDNFILGTLEGQRVAFLARHGRGHRILPTELPFRANIYGMKLLGVEWIISASAVGSLQERYAPTDFVIPDQFFDRTRGRASTFFGEGIVGHITFAHPVCGDLSEIIAQSCETAGVTVHRGGTYVCIEGPSFSTKAESQVNRGHGFSVVGMTLVPEYKLAREAEICYATVSLVTDYDVWKEGEEVSVDKVVATMHANVDRVKKMIAQLLPRLTGPRSCHCGTALRGAVFTDPKVMKPSTRKKLNLFLRGPE